MQNLEAIKDSNFKVGVKQCIKALLDGNALLVFIAKDAEQHVVRRIIQLSSEKNIHVTYVPTMKELGKACNIDVGAATAVIIK